MNPLKPAVCVFCSSSDAVDSVHFDVAADLGAEIGRRGMALVYGGTNVGLMGALAVAASAAGARVTGIVPGKILDVGIANNNADELVVTRDMRERKAVMEAHADGFIAMPGGFGTVEEVLEILTLKQLGFHSKPVVLLNTNGFYYSLLAFLEELYAGRFAKPAYRDYYHVATTPAAALDYIESYRPPSNPGKWF